MTAVIALLGALLSVSAGVESARADATGSISGTVLAAGTPTTNLSGASVSLYDSVQQYRTTTTTDDGGNYTFTGLPAGSYTLDFQSPVGENFVEQWWNDKPEYSGADFFPLADGQALTGINATLVHGASLSGTVFGAGSPNAPLANGYVYLQLVGAGLGIASAFTDSNGNFTINNVAAGTYTLEFEPPFSSTTYIPQWWQSQSVQANAQSITIAAAQALDGFNAVLPLAASISGTVIGSDTSAPVSGTQVEAFDGDGSTAGFATVGSDGSYRLNSLVPGTYTLSFTPPYGTNYLTQYWNDKLTAATANPITVAGGVATTGIDATLAVGATVSGLVTTIEAPSVGLAGASVVAVDSSGNELTSATTDANGNYSVVGLASGSYRILFQAPSGDSHALQYWKKATTFDKATPVNVTTGAVTSGIDAALTSGATISGTVSDTTTTPATPLAYADVIAQTPTGTFVTEAFADELGNYTLTNLPATTLVVKFAGQLDGAYVPSWWQSASKLGSATRIKVTAGAALTGIDGSNAPAYMTPGKPTITGTAKVGSTLTANPGKWKPSGSDTTFTYQWKQNGVPITGATASTYVPVNTDAGKTLAVTVTGDHYDFNDVSATSPATKIVTGGTLTTIVPQINGSPTRGSILTAVPGSWGPGTVSLTYRWSRNGTKIAGATSSIYTVLKADAGKSITVTVSGTETGFTSASQTSPPTAPAS